MSEEKRDVGVYEIRSLAGLHNLRPPTAPIATVSGEVGGAAATAAPSAAAAPAVPGGTNPGAANQQTNSSSGT
jgi:CDP-diglyceride synthetase